MIAKTLLATCTLFVLALTSTPAAQADGTDASALTTRKGPVSVHPVHHASVVMQWNGQTIYVDPTGAIARYKGLGTPDLILITHAHSDHLSPKTLNALDTDGATMVMPQAVADKIGDGFGKTQVIMANGDTRRTQGIMIHAVPMYNLPDTGHVYHPKGRGNGYVLTLAEKRIYISGDTENTPEMRSLKHIDLAFVCMNLPYTMTPEQAAKAVLAFEPAVVYPYHYRGQDTQKFKRLVEADNPAIEVRLRDWYPNQQ